MAALIIEYFHTGFAFQLFRIGFLEAGHVLKTQGLCEQL